MCLMQVSSFHWNFHKTTEMLTLPFQPGSSFPSSSLELRKCYMGGNLLYVRSSFSFQFPVPVLCNCLKLCCFPLVPDLQTPQVRKIIFLEFHFVLVASFLHLLKCDFCNLARLFQFLQQEHWFVMVYHVLLRTLIQFKPTMQLTLLAQQNCY